MALENIFEKKNSWLSHQRVNATVPIRRAYDLGVELARQVQNSRGPRVQDSTTGGPELPLRRGRIARALACPGASVAGPLRHGAAHSTRRRRPDLELVLSHMSSDRKAHRRTACPADRWRILTGVNPRSWRVIVAQKLGFGGEIMGPLDPP